MFKTRTHGTQKQIGKRFPVLEIKEKPKFDRGTLARRKSPLSIPVSPTELHAADAEAELLEAGFKGWTITVKYQDGTMEDVPCIAKTWKEALEKAEPQFQHINTKAVDEIVIVDPDLGEVFHKIGAGARRVAGGIAKGVKFAVRKVRETGGAIRRRAVGAAETLGRIAGTPAEMREAYEAGREYRMPEEEMIEAPPPQIEETGPIAVPGQRVVSEEQWRREAVPLYTRGVQQPMVTEAAAPQIPRRVIPEAPPHRYKDPDEIKLEKELRILHLNLGKEEMQEELDWMKKRKRTRTSGLGYFGKSPLIRG